MLRTPWRKVLRDIWINRPRAMLVVLSIAIGVFAVGTFASTRVVLLRELNASYAAVSPANATLYTAPFDEDMVYAVRRVPGVREAEGRGALSVRLILGPDEERPLHLVAIPDFNDIRVNQVRLERGTWPPPRRELLIERASLNYAGAELGHSVLIETPEGKQYEMRVAGVAHDLTVAPPALAGTAYGYITFDTLELLTGGRGFSELNILVADSGNDKEVIQSVANQVANKIGRGGYEVYYTLIPEPERHPLDTFLKPMLLLLGVLGFLSLLLSGFLVINTISAVLAQQTRQIGVMKAVGARTSQITKMYLGMVLVYALLALVVALPLGALGARAFTSLIAGYLNVDIANFKTPAQVVALEVGIGLVVPLLAALHPVTAGTRVTVRQAISSYGLGRGHFGTGTIDRLLRATSRYAFMSRPLLLSLRNTFRRKGRLALTLITLTLAGAIFIGVFSVRASLLHTLDLALEYWQFDVELNFSHPYRVEKIEREALRVPGVVAAESWAFRTANRLRPDDTLSDTVFIVAPPAETQMLRPIVREGRWLLESDEAAVVINTEVLRAEPDIRVGDEITLNIEERETTWRVVGLVQGVMTGPIVYINYPFFAQVTHDVGRAGRVQVITARHDADFQAQLANALEEHYEAAGMHVSSTALSSTLRAQLVQLFDVIVALLSVTALLLAAVGVLGLMGTMSINVLERTREIGVMRAVGASDGAVRQIVMVEGALIGMLSWLIGGLVAFPLSKLLSSAVGMSLLQTPLNYTFSMGGALLWLVIVIILAGLSSLLPARRASRLTVREVLAYE